jgi:ATP-binding cassette subfamily B (MDR/TAP) protein 1
MVSQKSHLSSSTTLAASCITSINTIKTHSTQGFFSHKYTQSARKSTEEYFTQAHLSALQLAFVRFMVLGLFVAGFWFGSYLVATKKSTPGAVVTAFWSVFMASQALETVMPQLLGLERGKQAAADLRGVITSREGRSRSRKSIARNPGLQRPEECQGGVELKGVGFRYPDRDTERVLKGVDMVFPVGRITYVIGRSGAGKSTVGALIAGMYRPNEGQVFIDGFCGKTLDPEWWRENVSLVMQQGTLFDETVGGNIAFGRGSGYLEVNEQEIMEAVRVAGLGRDISEFPKGLQTKVGRGGKELSGGQLQRVSDTL